MPTNSSVSPADVLANACHKTVYQTQSCEINEVKWE